MGANAVGSKLDRLKIIAFALELKVKAAGPFINLSNKMSFMNRRSSRMGTSSRGVLKHQDTPVCISAWLLVAASLHKLTIQSRGAEY